MRLPVVVLLAALMVPAGLAGCVADDAAPTQASVPPTSAPPPAPAAEFGSITGVVTDDEKTPIPAAQVTILDLTREATTDEAGAFTFNEIPPGTFGVVATRPGFAQTAKKLDVRAGEITEVTFILKPYVLVEEPYHLTLPYRALITFGQVFVDNRIPGGNPLCQGCDVYPRITPGPRALIAEITFTNGVTVSVDDVWVDVRRNWTNATGSNSQSDGFSVGNAYVKDRGVLAVTEENLKSLTKVDRIWYHVASGLAPSLNRRVDSFVSLAYHGPLPEGFTGLPPK